MGRSVSTPSGCSAVAYQHTDLDEFDLQEDWEWKIDDIRERVQALWPSFEECDEWLDREDHAVCENGHAYVGVSEYCGLTAVWLVVKGDSEHPELAEAWCDKIAAKFEEEFGSLNKIGTASNGESFFEARV